VCRYAYPLHRADILRQPYPANTKQIAQMRSEKGLVLRATVSVGGRRWRRLPNIDALRAAESDSPVYILDPATGIVRFGDGLHGAQPPTGALVRVHYRQGGGAAGDVAVCWEGRWPPRPFALAKSMVPSCLTMRSSGHQAKGGGATR
jgi:hypothetical protein